MDYIATTLLVLLTQVVCGISAPQAVGRHATLTEPFKDVPGPEKDFTGIKISKNSKQIIYYHEQTIAVIELGAKRSLLNCELLEVKTARDRNVAFSILQSIEKKTKLSFRYMMDLMKQCEKLPHPDSILSNKIPSIKPSSTEAPAIISSLFHGLFPNTKWCGRGDAAATYFDIGTEASPDRCCRTHDLCPVKISSMSTQYNVTNYSLTTRSHCLCDEAFFNCLKKSQNSISDLIGNVYFNLGNLQCVDDTTPNHNKKGLNDLVLKFSWKFIESKIMDETVVLILLAVVMLVGSYLAGSIPLVVHLSEEKLQLVSVLGAGMLVGTALTVIIPEGVRSLLSDQHQHVPDTKISQPGVEPEPHEDTDVHQIIGLSLVLGFLLMLLIDQFTSSRSRAADAETLMSGGGGNEHGVTATVGLVVHSAADGVALGAAASTAHHDVEVIIFLAIMLHKAPAAFGLVTFLLHEGLERGRIRKHLLIFSLAAPVMALLTYFGLGQDGKDTLSSVNATGAAMLFSAGTFLYVATVHVLPELTMRRSHSSGAHSSRVLRKSELLALIIGALLPSLLSMGHHH